MNGHNICFCWEIRKIILNYPQYPPLTWSSGSSYYLIMKKDLRSWTYCKYHIDPIICSRGVAFCKKGWGGCYLRPTVCKQSLLICPFKIWDLYTEGGWTSDKEMSAPAHKLLFQMFNLPKPPSFSNVQPPKTIHQCDSNVPGLSIEQLHWKSRTANKEIFPWRKYIFLGRRWLSLLVYWEIVISLCYACNIIPLINRWVGVLAKQANLLFLPSFLVEVKYWRKEFAPLYKQIQFQRGTSSRQVNRNLCKLTIIK